MKIVHTSDWHAGKIWKGESRLDELDAVLNHLVRFVATQKVDLVLMSGDIFDSGTPSPEAERLVYRIFRKLGESGAKTVVIAGNHDHPSRVEAWGTLTELVNVFAVGRPKHPDRGGVLGLSTASGERARVAVLPFSGVRNLVSATDLAESETLAHQKFAEASAELLRLLSSRFETDAVNLVVAHTLIDGADFAKSEGSERPVHMGESWASSAQGLPSAASYIALGHIHKPQRIHQASAPTEYAGSPLQLDFGEAGELKSFVLIEATPGLPVRTERFPYEGGRELVRIYKSLAELEAGADVISQLGWLHVEVPLPVPDPELVSKVRALLPRAVTVVPVLPEVDEASKVPDRPALNADPSEIYRAYYQHTNGGAEAPSDLVEAFVQLWSEAESDGVES